MVSRRLAASSASSRRIAVLLRSGRESKLNAKNAWGTTTGYADELAKRGMVEIDEYGEDKLARRRQQLENWRSWSDRNGRTGHCRRTGRVCTEADFIDRSNAELVLRGRNQNSSCARLILNGEAALLW